MSNNVLTVKDTESLLSLALQLNCRCERDILSINDEREIIGYMHDIMRPLLGPDDDVLE